MAAVEITCPHCNRLQKVAEYRLKETVYCLICQQLITDVYLYKVEPKQQELTIKLKGRIVSEFGTTKLEDLKSKSDGYTGKFEPVDDNEEASDANQREETTRLFESGSFRALPDRHHGMSTAAKTYLIGGIAMAALTICVVIIGVTVLTGSEKSRAEIDTAGADGTRLERWPNGKKKTEWRVAQVDGQELTDGLWQEWHEDGTLAVAGEYSAGNKVGNWRTWHSNGRPASEGEFADGKPIGTWTEWHRNGTKSAQGDYIAGEKQGEWRAWYSNGAFAAFERYEKGLPVGDWTEWYDDGRTKTVGFYKEGLKQDRWVSYYDNAVEELSEGWKDGVMHGRSHGTYRNRQRSFEGEWQNGKRVGTWTWWHSNGEKSKEGAFSDGFETGEWREWHATGILKVVGSYAGGLKTGEWRETDEDGNLAAVRQYRDGAATSEKFFFRSVEVQRRAEMFDNNALKSEWTVLVDTEGDDIRHGYMHAYYPSGKLAEVGAYVNGEKDGLWLAYDEDGNIIIRETYIEGRKLE